MQDSPQGRRERGEDIPGDLFAPRPPRLRGEPVRLQKRLNMIDRRSFLKVTIGAAAIATLGPRADCAAPKRNLRKAIMYSTIGVKGSVLEQFRAMKEAGFEGIEPMGGMKREEVIAAFKETGL